jgi:hypothetical protein
MENSNIYTKEALEEMDHIDLVRFANTMYGLNVNKDYEHHDLVDMVVKSQRLYKGNAAIKIVNDGNEDEVPPGYMKIRVQPGKWNPNNRPIFISHNFKSATIPVNKDLIMPSQYESCLKDAVRDEYFNDPDTREFIKQEVQSYPYSVLDRG